MNDYLSHSALALGIWLLSVTLLLDCSGALDEPLPATPNGYDLSSPTLLPSAPAPVVAPDPPAHRRYVRRPFRKQAQ